MAIICIFVVDMLSEELYKSRHAIRWYVMTLSYAHRGAVSLLQNVEYFAPSFIEVKESRGKLIKSKKQLLYNYVFIHSSETEIFKIKQSLPYFNFMPRVHDNKGGYHYPFLSDSDMENFRWIAQSYDNIVPLYSPEPQQLVKGDRVRIINGQFTGVEATVMYQPKGGRRDIVVTIEQWKSIPLLNINQGDYEIIELRNNKGDKHQYSHLDNSRLSKSLHSALCNFHYGVDHENNIKIAKEVLSNYGSIKMDSDIMRCKLYSFLLPAYIILNDQDRVNGLLAIMKLLLNSVEAQQSKALLLLTLYSCTNSSLFYEEAHNFVAPWRKEEILKKNKSIILQRMEDFDRCFNH